MNIAIVAPSPMPFVMGGAENLWLGLQRYINEETAHHCELFKMPSHEKSLIEIIDSYREVSVLDLNIYDKLITGKYPAWMVQHHNHAIYMLHKLRGLYDTYHFFKEPTDFEFAGKPLLELQNLMCEIKLSSKKSNQDIRPLFDFLDDFLKNNIDAHAARLPGPFSRNIIHYIDEFALNPSRISTYSAISNTVRSRADYFPVGAKVGVTYPPPRLEGFDCKGDEFLFTSSRLDNSKRIGLLIQAMGHVRSNIKLMIGGTGPDEVRLREMANGDARIVFLGYLSDKQLLDYYANALCVPFVPYDEDYGLITIEAMRSGKPVITTIDSGGVTEFVVNRETGFVVAPNPEEIAKAMDYMSSHRDEARTMGRSARRLVKDITWSKVAEQLIGTHVSCNSTKPISRFIDNRPKMRMVVAVTFPIYPPRGGGQSRIYNLYREWTRYFDIEIISLTGCGEEFFSGEISPGLTEIRIPKSIEHQKIEETYSRMVDWVPVTDIVAGRAINATPDYSEKLRVACSRADIVVASHPYFVELLRTCAPNVPLWFEAHNVEYKLKKNILPPTDGANSLLEMVFSDEARAWREAQVVYACSDADLQELTSLYGLTTAKSIVVPNGFATDEVKFVNGTMRADLKENVGLGGKSTILFMGSWHGPNLDAVEKILSYAAATPSLTYLIVGSAGLKFATHISQSNVKFLGVVDEKEKQVLLSAADLAINPMVAGSGSNLKMLDYFAAGVPVMSTRFGARGINVDPSIHYIFSEIDDFIFNITKFFVQPKFDEIDRMCNSAARLVSLDYSWAAIAESAYRELVKFNVK